MQPRVLFRSLDLVADDPSDTTDEDSSAELLQAGALPSSHHRRIGVRILAVSLLLSAVLAVSFNFSSKNGVRDGSGTFSPRSVVSLNSANEPLSLDSATFKAAGSGFLSKMQKHMHSMLESTLHPTKYNATTPQGQATSPYENRNDGNVCGDDEELLGRLCYKKCSLLTAGEYPHRTTAMSCCKSHPCSFTNQKVVMKMCGGFDVSGGMQNACPHAPGACLDDEELSLGMCFKKCSLLTNGEYPHRSAAGTCCQTTGLACMEPWNTKTAKEFDVGGGKGDGDQSTPAKMHAPIAALTESSLGESTRVVLK